MGSRAPGYLDAACDTREGVGAGTVLRGLPAQAGRTPANESPRTKRRHDGLPAARPFPEPAAVVADQIHQLVLAEAADQFTTVIPTIVVAGHLDVAGHERLRSVGIQARDPHI